MLTGLESAGDGAYSEVYKVKRNSDNQIYALKKVSVLISDESPRQFPFSHSKCNRSKWASSASKKKRTP